MTTFDGYSCQLATFATLGAIIVTVVCLAITFRVMRDRLHPMRRFLTALIAFSVVTVFLSFELGWLETLGASLLALTLVPLITALMAMTAAAVVGVRDGTLGRRAWLAAAGELGAVAVAVFVLVMWKDLRQREELYNAATRGDLNATQALMMRTKSERRPAVRQRLLVNAASQLNFEMVRKLVTEGADVNGAAMDSTRHLSTPLLSIVGAQLPEGSSGSAPEFAMRRIRTINYLLRRGADPDGRATPDGPTAIEAARDASLADVSALLQEQKNRGVGK